MEKKRSSGILLGRAIAKAPNDLHRRCNARYRIPLRKIYRRCANADGEKAMQRDSSRASDREGAKRSASQVQCPLPHSPAQDRHLAPPIDDARTPMERKRCSGLPLGRAIRKCQTTRFADAIPGTAFPLASSISAPRIVGSGILRHLSTMRERRWRESDAAGFLSGERLESAKRPAPQVQYPVPHSPSRVR